MTLIQQVKRTKIRGSQVYGIVELAILGKATVIPIGSRQKMSNLPIYGETLRTGDTVIIDYSADGQPYVRKAIPASTATRPPINVTVNDASIATEDGFVAGKVMLTGDQTFTDTVAGNTITWTPILFDLVLYDTDDIWNDGMFGSLLTGQYIVNVNLGFKTDVVTSDGWAAVQVINYKKSTGALTPQDFRIPYSKDVQFYGGGGSNTHIVNFSTLCRVSEGDNAIGLALAVYTTAYIECEILQAYSWFSIHKLKNLAVDNTEAVRGFWDSAGAYF